MEALTVQQGVLLNIGLLRNILTVIDGVQQFRRQCVELGNMVALLLVMMEGDQVVEENDSSIAGSNLSPVVENQHSAFSDANTSARLNATLKEIHAFVGKCIGEWNIWQRGWEVVVTRKLPRLKQELFEWITLCLMETSSSTKNELRVKSDMQIKNLKKIRRNLQELLTRADSAQQQMNTIQRIGQLQAEQGQNGDRVAIRFPAGDSRLQVVGNLVESQDFIATLKDVGQVICKEVKNDEIRSGRGSRHVEIYHLISTSTLVQVFYGIAELEGKRYAVMEDLRGDPTLAAAIQSAELNDPLARLRLTYEVANAVAYLHSVGVVIKNISDVNIVLKRLEGQQGFRPCLTNLEEARKFVESTSFVAYDVRFESPEYRTRNHHSHHSDVWSLGVVVWECVVGTFPFAVAPDDLCSDEDKRGIRKKLADGILPWDIEADRQSWEDVYTIVRSCWNLCPALRPPASYVAQTLLEFYTHRSIGAPSPIDEVPSQIQDALFGKICAKREGVHAAATNVSVEDALMLKRSVDTYNDPRNSFLLGAAIWWELVPVEAFSDSFSEGRLEYNGPELPPEVKRARVALSYMENSVDEAWTETGLAYALLARHFLDAV